MQRRQTRAHRSTSMQLELPPTILEEMEGGRVKGAGRRDSATAAKLDIIQKHGMEQSEMYFKFADPKPKSMNVSPTRRRSNFSPNFGDKAKDNHVQENLDETLREIYNADGEEDDMAINSRKALLMVSPSFSNLIADQRIPVAARVRPF